MSEQDSDSPQKDNLIAVILGAEKFPHSDKISGSESFKTSADDFVDYLTEPSGLGIRTDRILNLFGDKGFPLDQDKALSQFIGKNSDAEILILYYVGHGGFLIDREYFLALHSTEHNREHHTGLRIDDLATSLYNYFPKKRIVLILDSCFAGEAVSAFQNQDLVKLVGPQLDNSFSLAGTSILAAASKDEVAINPKEDPHTMFSGSLVDVLKNGIKGKASKLSLDEIGEELRALMRVKFGIEAVIPEIHSPRQDGGDVAKIRIFPNRAYKASAVKDLPEKLLDTLSDPLPDRRKAGVIELSEILIGSDEGMVDLAKKELQKLAQEDDSISVREMAMRTLQGSAEKQDSGLSIDNLTKAKSAMAPRSYDLSPIVGHTTDSSCRIWVRANEHANGDGAIGVAGIVEESGKDLSRGRIEAFYFIINPRFGYTGIFPFGYGRCLSGKHMRALKPETDYAARVIIRPSPVRLDFDISSDLLAERMPDPNVWIEEMLAAEPRMSEARFRTFPKESNASNRFSFLLANCRYNQHSDKIFGPIRQNSAGIFDANFDAESVKTARASFVLLFVRGDARSKYEIDSLETKTKGEVGEQFQSYYLETFSHKYIGHLMRSTTMYMVYDDGNVSGDRLSSVAAEASIQQAMIHQVQHGPDSFHGHLYYKFECGDYPFFVLDNRTQRFIEDVQNDLADNDLLGRPSLGREEPSQLERLLKWLVDCQVRRGNTPKFIVSSSVFAPNPMRARTGRKGSAEQKITWAVESDSWPAFPNTRMAILNTIVSKQIQNVIFLSGDFRCANVAQLTFAGTTGAAKLKAYSITSSAFYRSSRFADGAPSNFVHDSKDAKQMDTFKIAGNKTMDYRAWNFTQEDNFCRVDVDRQDHTIRVTPFDQEGEVICGRNWDGAPSEALISTLALEPW